MATKEFNFRGKVIEELKEMDTREFAKLVKSRERRTILRQFNDIENFIVKCKRVHILLYIYFYNVILLSIFSRYNIRLSS